MTSHPKRAAGFTMIEIAIALGVMTALMAITVPMISGFGATARIQATAADMSGIADAARLLYHRNRTALASCDLSVAAPPDPQCAELQGLLPSGFKGKNPVSKLAYLVEIDETKGTEALKTKAKIGGNNITFASGWDEVPVVYVKTCLTNADAQDAVKQNNWSLKVGANCGGNKYVELQQLIMPSGEGFHLMMLRLAEETWKDH